MSDLDTCYDENGFCKLCGTLEVFGRLLPSFVYKQEQRIAQLEAQLEQYKEYAHSADRLPEEPINYPRIKQAQGDPDGIDMPREVLVELENGDAGWYSLNLPYGEYIGIPSQHTQEGLCSSEDTQGDAGK